jgi:hypothetical protein
MGLNYRRRKRRRWKIINADIRPKQDEVSVDRKKQTTIIVDADDKNCLVQLTVAQKLNQGVRQWP